MEKILCDGVLHARLGFDHSPQVMERFKHILVSAGYLDWDEDRLPKGLLEDVPEDVWAAAVSWAANPTESEEEDMVAQMLQGSSVIPGERYLLKLTPSEWDDEALLRYDGGIVEAVKPIKQAGNLRIWQVVYNGVPLEVFEDELIS
jgi:hypothetical protein